jgi:hypothetical protein
MPANLSTVAKRLADAVRTGDFLDRARVRRIAVIVSVTIVVALIAILATSSGGIDPEGRPLGPDFFSFWSAARVAAADGPQVAYDIFRNRDFQSDYLDGASLFFVPFWSTPPFLLLITPFAALPFPLAWAAFSGATFTFYVLAMRRLAPPTSLSLLVIAGAPGVLSNASIGQTGFLLAALFAAAAAAYPKRPLIAGVFIGLIALKPQYGLLIPLCLLIDRRWKTILAATLVVMAEVAVSIAAFGSSIWSHFLANGEAARYVLLESGAVHWEKNVSLYAMLRRVGVEGALAYAAQGVYAAVCAGGLVLLWRSAADYRLKLAGLITASLMATPYALDYDLLILAPAIALIVSVAIEDGFRNYEKATLALAWLAPLICYTASVAFNLPVGLLALAATFSIILARAPIPLLRRSA